MPDFSWRTEEAEWDELAAPAGEDGGRSRNWRAWVLGVLVVAVAVAGGIFAYRQLDERVDEATGDVETAVLSSHNLVREAARQQDAELFINFLSGRDPDWATAQETLVAEGVLFDRQPLGLRVLPAGADSSGITQTHTIDAVTLSPDLTEAEVDVSQAYAIDVGNGVTDVVRLRQTSLYRKGPDSWLYAPPKDPDAYWGERGRSEGRRLTVTYPARDAELAVRLAGDLEAKVAQMCAQVMDLDCPAGFHVEVRFSTDPRSLRVVSLVAVQADSLTIDLPTPTLVGLPADGAAYQALYRGYATAVAGFAIRHLIEPCCGSPLFFQALWFKQLHRLGLQPWPLTAADYATIRRYPFSLWEGWAIWEAERPAARREARLKPYAIVDFLLHQAPQTSPVTLMRALAEAGNYWLWLQAASGSLSDAELEAAWQEFVFAQAAPRVEPLPISPPQQEVLLLCPAGDGADDGANELVRYDPAGDAWTAVPTARTPVDVEPVPGSDGLVLAEVDENENQALYLSLWQDGAFVPLWNSADGALPGTFVDLAVDPTGRTLVLSGYTVTPDNGWFFLLDVEACRDGVCAPQPVTGRPVWSPDGEHMIVLTRNQGAGAGDAAFSLNLADRERNLVRSLGGGRLPVWLDNETFLYVTTVAGNPPPLTRLMQGTVAGDVTRIVLTVSELSDAVPGANIGPSSSLVGLAANPANRNQLFLVVNDGRSDTLSFFRYELASEDLALLYQTGAQTFLRADGPSVLNFAPAGNGWAATVADGEADTLLLHDVMRVDTISLVWRGDTHTGLWSPDGQWFLKVEGGFVTLLAPGYHDARVTRHPRPGCLDAVWLPE